MWNCTISQRGKGNFWLISILMIFFLPISSSNVRHSYLLQAVGSRQSDSSLKGPYRKRNREFSLQTMPTVKKAICGCRECFHSTPIWHAELCASKKKKKEKKNKVWKKNAMCKPTWAPQRLFWLSADRSFLRLPRLWLRLTGGIFFFYRSIDCCCELWWWRDQSHTCDVSAGKPQGAAGGFTCTSFEGHFKTGLTLNQLVRPAFLLKCHERGSNKDLPVVDYSCYLNTDLLHWPFFIFTVHRSVFNVHSCVIPLYFERISKALQQIFESKRDSHWFQCICWSWRWATAALLGLSNRSDMIKNCLREE